MKSFGLLLGALVLTFIFIEFVLFGLIFLPADIPRLKETQFNEVLRYDPYQAGTWRIGNTIHSAYQINNDGWNSGHTKYRSPRSNPSRNRVGIIGDSYIEALQVDFNKSVAEKLEELLPATDVYRFGISGAPLSQYVKIFDYVLSVYSPDVVVINVVNNDFIESLPGVQTGTFSASFDKWQISTEGQHYEILPAAPYHPGWIALIKSTNIYGYFFTRKKLRLGSLREMVLNFSLDGMQSPQTEHSQFITNTSVRDLSDPRVFRIIDVFALELTRIQHRYPKLSRLIILLDGPRGRSKESCRKKELSPRLLGITEKMSAAMMEHGIEFYPLWEDFFDQECMHGHNMKLPDDGHWSEDAHDFVAKKLERLLRSENQ